MDIIFKLSEDPAAVLSNSLFYLSCFCYFCALLLSLVVVRMSHPVIVAVHHHEFYSHCVKSRYVTKLILR